jgi:hypothetical protein
MTTYAISTTCPVVSTINTAPSITAAASSYNIPASTPFYLTATATDNGSGLTYTWEQMDAGTSGVPPVSTATSGPNFRSYLPSANPTREHLGETTAGKGNSTTNWSCASALSGNDVLYQIDVPTGTTSIYVALNNVSATVRLIWLGTNCSTTCVDTHTSSEGACQYTFATPSAGTYYLVVDHANASDVTYDIAFGGALAANNTTDTRGSWWFDVDCTSPSFKRNFNVTWGGTDMTFPLTLSPLNVQNTLCTEVFFKNPTGQEGLRKAVFTFDADLSGLTLATPTIPGFYNTGTCTAQ